MLQKLFATSILFTSFSYSFIHIDPPVIGEKEGLSGEVSVSGKHSSGNNDSTAMGLAGKGEYFGSDWLVYLIASYTYGESNDRKDTNDGSAHLRYVHSIGDSSYDYELFLQTEFNEFQHIKQRNLIGANIRTKLDIFFDKFYAGLGLFYSYMEPEEVTVYDPVYKRTRINSYLSFSKKVHQNFSVSYLGYYQPNVEDLSDYRISQIVQFNTSITEDLMLGFDVNHAYNATPYYAVEKNDIRTTINLRYKF